MLHHYLQGKEWFDINNQAEQSARNPDSKQKVLNKSWVCTNTSVLRHPGWGQKIGFAKSNEILNRPRPRREQLHSGSNKRGKKGVSKQAIDG